MKIHVSDDSFKLSFISSHQAQLSLRLVPSKKEEEPNFSAGKTTTNKEHLCTECGKKSLSRAGWYAHMKRHDQRKKGLYHILTHEKKTYQCNVCSEIFHHPFRLRRHVKKYHENNPKPIFQCNFCGMQVTTGCSLKNHIRTHTGEKPFECQWCGKNFTTSQQLKGHRVVHTKEKPFACKICPKRFTQKGTLSLHVRSRHQVAETTVKNEPYEVDS
ncbi:hypothetical protein D910_07716 [Dendroctonus ponderosae]|uniref:C2H2-type domain-containing protein n=1 Tax=Dendroctonus ponderosae TaxID=77166 RepID=U4UBF3_DENPD|nr:hypothetical protein D910_07716 [Dendroctonus ponderosae]